LAPATIDTWLRAVFKEDCMRKEAVVIGMTIAAAAFAITCAALRLRQVDAGICPRTGVQTSDADLRTGVISSLIGIGAENIRHQNAEHYRDGLGLRVAGPMSDSEIAKALFDLKNGGIGFAEEFGAREVAQVPDGKWARSASHSSY